MRLSGKVALVTGAADERSIGWGIVKALADEGVDVIVNDITLPDQLEKRVAELQALGRRGLAIQADVTKADEVEAMMERAIAEMGRLDIVCSNAGIIRWEPFLEVTARELQAVVNVNIMGNVHMCQSSARQMIKQGQGGRIIITSSVQSEIQFPITPIYGGTKFAMHTFVGCLALELAEYNITVNHLGPGWVRSALNDPAPGQQTSDEIEQLKASVPLGHRPGLPYEMGRAAVYFASADGDYVTGAFIKLDGGLALGR